MRTAPIDELPGLVGVALGPTEWIDVDQERIDAFADTTDDHQFIHVDPVAAQATPWGSTVAHGYLTLSLVSHFLGEMMVAPEGTQVTLNYGSDRVRFLEAVPSGSRVRGRAVLVEFTEKRPGRWLAKHEVSVEIEGVDTPAMVAEPLTMFVTG
jgi:acyl dehydratase